MKFSTAAISLATVGLVAAGPHQHQHRHHHKRAPVVARDSDSAVLEYVLNGEPIPAAQVCEGIANGTLAWADGQAPPGACQSLSSSSSATPTPTPTPTPSPAAFFEETSSSSSMTPPASTPSAPAPSPSSSSTAASTPSASPSSSPGTGATGLDADFPDGELDCGTFPSDYGAVPLHYLGFDGWSGIQYLTWVGEAVSKIVTAISGDSCHEASMCSYACPPGYQKSQWPETQGSTGESIGGIQCRAGKLWLTNPDYSKKLCVRGVGGVHVKNTLNDQVAVCRTDYPGTESQTVPLGANTQTTEPLTCPAASQYYQWKGKPTSAQYYVNPKGVSTEVGCQWGDGSQPIGNFAPINLGVGENNGKWLSIFQNSPTTNEHLDFNIKIQGENLSGSCRYENGKYYSLTGSNDSGCTVEVLSGDAYYVFY